jgi:hypothetical protein
MTGEREIDYEGLVQKAMRSVVRSVLSRVAKAGLPGEHHFYIAFKTDAPGVSLSKRLKEKYPEEMTVVLQHRFWDLLVTDDHFEVKLTFDSIPERLLVPFDAVKVFFDPSVPYGLQFDDADAAAAGAQPAAPPMAEARDARSPKRTATVDKAAEEVTQRAEKKPRNSRRSADKAAERPAPPPDKVPTKPALVTAKPSNSSSETKVVSIDAFRKK